jgi:hypothetical protein
MRARGDLFFVEGQARTYTLPGQRVTFDPPGYFEPEDEGGARGTCRTKLAGLAGDMRALTKLKVDHRKSCNMEEALRRNGTGHGLRSTRPGRQDLPTTGRPSLRLMPGGRSFTSWWRGAYRSFPSMR